MTRFPAQGSYVRISILQSFPLIRLGLCPPEEEASVSYSHILR